MLYTQWITSLWGTNLQVTFKSELLALLCCWDITRLACWSLILAYFVTVKDQLRVWGCGCKEQFKCLFLCVFHTWACMGTICLSLEISSKQCLLVCACIVTFLMLQTEGRRSGVDQHLSSSFLPPHSLSWNPLVSTDFLGFLMHL